MNQRALKRFATFFLAGYFGFQIFPLMAMPNDVCMSCHSQPGMGAPLVDEKKFTASIHGRNLCTSCHSDAAEIPHPAKLKPVSCRACHRLESEVYRMSDHGRALSKGVEEAATCTSCHGQTHTLLSSRNPLSPVHRTNLAQTCASCHADLGKMEGVRLTEKEPYETYIHSAHGEAFKKGVLNSATCSDCHGTHDLHASANPKSKVFRANIPDTCGRCHENVLQTFKRSVHGRAIEAGIKESPVCTDCHGEHTIRPIKDADSPVSLGAITRTCSMCHQSERLIAKFGLPTNRLSTYESSYHGLASRLGDMRAANCASCHGWHDVLPSYDPLSSIHRNNLANTCGKCHSGAQNKLFTGKIHGDDPSDQHRLHRLIELFYIILIPVLIGWMLFHNGIDYIRKALRGGPPGASYISRKEESLFRMNFNERLQHGFLILSFVILAVSGFALQYPDSWWAYVFRTGGEGFRKWTHRYAAIVFSITAVWHLIYMVGTRRGRFLLMTNLFPRRKDIVDPFRMMSYNLGLRKTRPHLGYPSYIERMEYWALVWGSVIMLVTGGILVFTNLALKYLPLWVSDMASMIHFYEALLASLAILVWHFYWVIFDPDVYPMNWSWLTGRLRFKKKDPPAQKKK